MSQTVTKSRIRKNHKSEGQTILIQKAADLVSRTTTDFVRQRPGAAAERTIEVDKPKNLSWHEHQGMIPGEIVSNAPTIMLADLMWPSLTISTMSGRPAVPLATIVQ